MVFAVFTKHKSSQAMAVARELFLWVMLSQELNYHLRLFNQYATQIGIIARDNCDR